MFWNWGCTFKFWTQTLLPALHIQVILYSGDRAYEDYYEPMRGRVHFNSADPKNGDASIILTGLKSSDSGTYQCKVKKAPGIRSRKMQLIVMGEWNKPLNTLSSEWILSLHSGNALNHTPFALLWCFDVIPSKIECITFLEAVELWPLCDSVCSVIMSKIMILHAWFTYKY